MLLNFTRMVDFFKFAQSTYCGKFGSIENQAFTDIRDSRQDNSQ